MIQVIEFDHLTLLEASVTGVGHSSEAMTQDVLRTRVLRLSGGQEVNLRYTIEPPVRNGPE